ncbi:uL30 family ribosomal protein [Ralstonia pseudosolanacearum]|uniref:uL30 family ribosomal protein n=1 Tax=Ralstonia pseudosolanacearum TaxID=1310165 RepID=UPI003D174906
MKVQLVRSLIGTREDHRATVRGLGLAVCEAIVSAHGGRIWVETPADGGACFVVALPASDQPAMEDDIPA